MKRVLVANRGEIAVRVIRACREMNIEAVAVYSKADANALHVELADRAICVGPARVTDSYLNMDAIIQIALSTGCDGIHPGYGFLSENPEFAQKCSDEGLTFIGPDASIIRAMGDKVQGRLIAKEAGVPIVDGTEGTEVSFDDVAALAQRSGFPVLLKAAAGGGGRGMRIVWSEDELKGQFEDAQAEALSSFGDKTVYAERFLPSIRHVEVQVMGNGEGEVIHFGTRDCTLQRRHQKVVEEAQATYFSPEKREEIASDAVRLASHLDYAGAGTVEFVVDAQTAEHFFIEVNTRIQVEHPVTEMITGVDLVREQLEVASNGRFSEDAQASNELRGHALELRINAEDPDSNFAPCPGRINNMTIPGGPGVRFDSHMRPGAEISPFYDSMIAKLIVHDINRKKAIARAQRALREFDITGVKTNSKFLLEIVSSTDFVNDDIDTGWLERR
ncbi:acetyl-CoA carboxylase biotin carboxylase subunit [Aquisalimonas lutea]|uniref:acetyl-CoA carboxylase biotin carboxylase subunit n=1 Tax=Aquisalimonas lutea TaxID=1327750 RepID=UPI0025B52832|nr:acetyl-CoA carboxylase biotin carboxylase subunit [Aquisalimonas lutea]MDN3519808.1 acetyl-CoA carboxylase biotin carboxylase subunit [Aquisalimonas lutea]